MSLSQVKHLDMVINSLIRQRTMLDRSIDDAIAFRNEIVNTMGSEHAALANRYAYRRPGGLPPRVVMVDGVQFASISECSRVMMIDKKTVKQRCRSSQFPGWQIKDAAPATAMAS